MKKFLLLSSLAATACLAVSVSAQQSFTFAPPDYSTGTIVGQNGWFGGGGNATNNALVADKAQIVSDPMDPFGNQFLELRGSRNAPAGTGKMNSFATVPLGGTPVSFSLDLNMAPEADVVDPAELFIRFNGWTSYVALKLTQDLVEFPGGNTLTDAGLLADTWYNFRVDYNTVGGVFTSADIYINNSLAGTVGGLNIDPMAGVNLELRSQNTLTTIDNFSVIPEPSTYAALFGLLAIGLVVVRRRLRK